MADRWHDRLASRLATSAAARPVARLASWQRPIAVAVAALAVLTAVGSTVQIVRVGHSGAKAVWSGTSAATR